MSITIQSGVFEVRPKVLLTLNAGGMIRLTPKKTYLAFKTDYEIRNQPGRSTVMIVKDNNRWFPVNENYAKNNFDYVTDEVMENQNKWFADFKKINEHIRTKVKEDFILSKKKVVDVSENMLDGKNFKMWEQIMVGNLGVISRGFIGGWDIANLPDYFVKK